MKPSRQSAVRRAKYSGKNSINMKVDLSAVNDMLKRIEGEIHGAVRPAAQAAAEVIYQAVLKNVDAIGAVTGNLRSAIYQAFSQDNSTAIGAGYSKATYHVSWNASKAPHGHLVEYGHIQKYAAYIGKDGKWHTAVRPEMQGTKAPWIGTGKNGRNRKGSIAEKDAYYLPRPGGPQQIAAKPFIRPAFYQGGLAAEAAKAKVLQLLGAKA